MMKVFKLRSCQEFLKSLAMLAVFCLHGHAYCSSADTLGLEVKAGDFSVEIYYSIISQSGGEVGSLMRDPAQMLFSVASFVQQNYDELEKSGKWIRVDLLQKEDLYPEDVAILEVGEKKGGEPIVYKFKAGTDLFEKISEYICTKVISRCRRASRDALTLYPCGKNNCPGEVQFGNGFWIDPPKYSLKPLNKGIKRIYVTRKNIHKIYPSLS